MCIDLLWIAKELEGQSTEKLEEGGTATGLEEYLHHIPHAINVPHRASHVRMYVYTNIQQNYTDTCSGNARTDLYLLIKGDVLILESLSNVRT